MTCDEVLAALATGSVLRRRQARRHVARCPRCAETVAKFERLTADLAAVPPLTAEQRAAWLHVADPAVRSFGSHRVRRVIVTAIVATAALIVAAILLTQPEPSDTVARVGLAPVAKSAASSVEAVRALDAMQTRLDEVEREMMELARRAELLDVRQDADELWVQYGPQDPPRTL